MPSSRKQITEIKGEGMISGYKKFSFDFKYINTYDFVWKTAPQTMFESSYLRSIVGLGRVIRVIDHDCIVSTLNILYRPL